MISLWCLTISTNIFNGIDFGIKLDEASMWLRPYKQATKKGGGRGGFFLSFFLSWEGKSEEGMKMRKSNQNGLRFLQGISMFSRTWTKRRPQRPQISSRNLSFSTRSSLCACLLQTTRRRRWFQEHVSNNNNFAPLFDEPDHRPNPRSVGRSVVSGGPRARRGGHSSDGGRKRSKGWLAASSGSQRPKGGD